MGEFKDWLSYEISRSKENLKKGFLSSFGKECLNCLIELSKYVDNYNFEEILRNNIVNTVNKSKDNAFYETYRFVYTKYLFYNGYIVKHGIK